MQWLGHCPDRFTIQSRSDAGSRIQCKCDGIECKMTFNIEMLGMFSTERKLSYAVPFYY